MSEPKAVRDFDLTIAREDNRPRREPAPHQVAALQRLESWYRLHRKAGGGGILVLPTGGGKTFMAVRFLCNGPLSDGYKVLWLAHTHHLLEQAAETPIEIPIRTSSCGSASTSAPVMWFSASSSKRSGSARGVQLYV